MHEPWKIPLLFGKLPAPPKADSDADAKGRYALFAMLLLRPWRQQYIAIQSWIGAPSHLQNLSQDSMWLALHDAYRNWRSELSKSAAPYFSRDPKTWLPAPHFGTQEWWNCRVYTIVENMDLAFAHPGDKASKIPDVQGLPLESDHDSSDMAIIFHAQSATLYPKISPPVEGKGS